MKTVEKYEKISLKVFENWVNSFAEKFAKKKTEY